MSVKLPRFQGYLSNGVGGCWSCMCCRGHVVVFVSLHSFIWLWSCGGGRVVAFVHMVMASRLAECYKQIRPLPT